MLGLNFITVVKLSPSLTSRSPLITLLFVYDIALQPTDASSSMLIWAALRFFVS